jgi:plastocyanin
MVRLGTTIARWNAGYVALVLFMGYGLFGLSSMVDAQECGKVHEVIVTHIFTPKDLVLEAGDCVRFVNIHEIEHSAVARTRTFNTGTLMPRSSSLIRFDTPGELPYVCGLHPPMIGTITVKSKP